MLGHAWNVYMLTSNIIFINIKVADTDLAKCDEFFAQNTYVAGSYDKAEDFANLNKEIDLLARGANRLFYLALPPSVFAPVTANIRKECMTKGYVEICYLHVSVYSESAYNEVVAVRELIHYVREFVIRYCAKATRENPVQKMTLLSGGIRYSCVRYERT